MLALTRLLRESGEQWKEIITAPPYCLNVKEKGNLVCFKYSQTLSDSSLQETKEARGIIYDKREWLIVACPFFRFFNYGEPNAAQLDWSNTTVREKIDGSLIKVYYYNNEWHVATSGTIDAEDAPLESPYHSNFKQLFDVAAQRSGLDYNKLNKYYTYMFELVSPENRVVVPYKETKLYHLGTRNLFTMKEIEQDIGVEKPSVYNLSSLEDCITMAKTFDFTTEGFVAVDANYNRVKIKSEDYLRVHRLNNNGNMNLTIAAGLLRNNEQNEFLSYFPIYKEYFAEVKNKIDAAMKKIDDINNETAAQKKELNRFYSERNAKKQFALSIKDNPLKNLYFLAWDKKLTQEWIESLTDDCFIKSLRLEN